jgi:hypothetical protein
MTAYNWSPPISGTQMDGGARKHTLPALCQWAYSPHWQCIPVHAYIHGTCIFAHTQIHMCDFYPICACTCAIFIQFVYKYTICVQIHNLCMHKYTKNCPYLYNKYTCAIFGSRIVVHIYRVDIWISIIMYMNTWLHMHSCTSAYPLGVQATVPLCGTCIPSISITYVLVHIL